MKKGKIIAIVIALLVVLVSISIVVYKYSIDKNQNDHQEMYFKLHSGSRYGIVDKNGNIIVKPEYEKVAILDKKNGVFFLQAPTGQKLYVDKNMKPLLENYDKLELILNNVNGYENYKNALLFNKNNKYGVVGTNGKVLIKPEYDQIKTLDKDSKHYLLRKDSKWAIADNNGQIIVKPIYFDIQVPQNQAVDSQTFGYIVVSNNADNNKKGYITEDGQTILKPEYESIEKLNPSTDTKNTYLVAQQHGKKGLYKNKTKVLPTDFEDIIPTDHTLIVKKDSKYGIFGLDGKEIVFPRFEKYAIYDNFVILEQDGKKYVFDPDGNQVSKRGFVDVISATQANGKNYLVVEKYTGQRSIVVDDEELPDEFLDITYIDGPNFAYLKDNKYGIFNVEKGMVTEPVYTYISPYENTHIIQAFDGNNTTIYDNEGNVIDKAQGPFAFFKITDDVIGIYTKDDKKYIDKNGKSVDLKNEHVKYIPYKDTQSGKWGYKDKSGKVVLQAKYDAVGDFNQYGFACVYEDKKWGSIDQNLNIVKDPKQGFEYENLVFPNFLGNYLIDEELPGQVYEIN